MLSEQAHLRLKVSAGFVSEEEDIASLVGELWLR